MSLAHRTVHGVGKFERSVTDERSQRQAHTLLLAKGARPGHQGGANAPRITHYVRFMPRALRARAQNVSLTGSAPLVNRLL